MDAKSVRSDTAASYAASKKAREQAAEVERMVKDTQAEGERKVESLREHYETEAVRTEIKGQERIEQEKLQGYEALQKTRREKNRSLESMTREAEKQEFDTRGHMQASLSESERAGKKKLDEAAFRHRVEMDRLNARQKAEAAQMRLEHERQYEALKTEKDGTIATVKAEQDRSLQAIRENAETTTLAAESGYRGRVESVAKEHAQSLGSIDQKTSEQLRSKQLSHAQKLSAYSSRAGDPFYKIVDLNARLREEAGAYVVTVTAPTHEQDSLKLTARGDQLVLSGKRQNLDRVETAPGSFKETSSYQAYREAFPVPLPVDERGISKTADGDTVTFRVPKKGVAAAEAAAQARKVASVEPIRAEKPRFPSNLPEPPTGSPSRTKPLG